MPQSEQEQFLDSLKSEDEKVDIFEAPITPETTPTPKEEKKEVKEEVSDEDTPKNRYQRRLLAKLEAERQSNIELQERLRIARESKDDKKETSDYLASIKRIYGEDSPEAKEATSILASALESVEERATRKALELFEQKQEEEKKAVREEEERLESMIDEIEDTYGVNFTPAMERGFFKLLERLSPKDENGEVRDYADPHAVWETYQARLTKKEESPAKDLASRSMTGSSGAGESVGDDATLRYLKENNLI